MPHYDRRYCTSARGFTFVEVACVLSALALGLLSLAAAMGSGMRTVAVNREIDVAAHAAREALERLQDPAGGFELVFASYNNDPDDDPAADVPGGTFDVEGLRGATGEILFPTGGDSGFELREDVADRDLDGDGEIDEENHALDYLLLPVTVRIRWEGVAGERSVEFATVLAQR
ncbi:MAG TPA: hypothetical protein VFY93_05325 [Planctomycetota bacterium]|nr:hypothetical protein [Planctomycetota bacterium]